MSKKLRVGIVTEYYNSVNYGGNLQAYALVRYLNEHGVYAEQIPYDKPVSNKLSLKKRICKYTLTGLAKKLIQKILLEPISRIIVKAMTKRHVIEMNKVKERDNLVLAFNQKIPHCNYVFNDVTINKCNKFYDVFITGSDQVWSLIDRKSYFLLFAEKDKYSYAASISKDFLDQEEKAFFREMLKDYKGISVREKETADMLADLTGKSIEWVTDPVFLLSEDSWKEMCSPRLSEEPYIFCYFLGGTKWHRKTASHYAKKRNLKIVTMPYLLGKYRFCDASFGDERFFKTTPEDFISLIRYAEYVITDSFHASAFSVIFGKKFFVFERQASASMGSRIRSLMELTGIQGRYYMTEKDALQNMEELSRNPYKINKDLLEDRIEKSKIFIEKVVDISI